MINWKVRIKSKLFWVTLIPAVILVIANVLSMFGVEIDSGLLTDKCLSIVGSVFALLTVLGVVVDPTTDGYKDSELAMTYAKEHDEFDSMGSGEDE